MTDDDPDGAASTLADDEREALHSMQLGVEHVFQAYGALLECHHHAGNAMGKFADAEGALREAGHDAFADDLRDRLLPAGAVGDSWTYELVREFREGFVDDLDEFESAVREELADGLDHVTERAQQRRWRERAESTDWRTDE